MRKQGTFRRPRYAVHHTPSHAHGIPASSPSRHATPKAHTPLTNGCVRVVGVLLSRPATPALPLSAGGAASPLPSGPAALPEPSPRAAPPPAGGAAAPPCRAARGGGKFAPAALLTVAARFSCHDIARRFGCRGGDRERGRCREPWAPWRTENRRTDVQTSQATRFKMLPADSRRYLGDIPLLRPSVVPLCS